MAAAGGKARSLSRDDDEVARVRGREGGSQRANGVLFGFVLWIYKEGRRRPGGELWWDDVV